MKSNPILSSLRIGLTVLNDYKIGPVIAVEIGKGELRENSRRVVFPDARMWGRFSLRNGGK